MYAPTLPGFQEHDEAADGDASFVGRFLDAVGLQRAVLVGHSLGGLAASLFALASPARVTAPRPGRWRGPRQEVSPALEMLSEPLLGGGHRLEPDPCRCRHRAWGKGLLLFGRPWRTPTGWLTEQYRLARRPGFLDAALVALRDQGGPGGQRRVLLDRLCA